MLITKEFSFEGFVDAVLNPVRQYAKDHCSVAIKLMDNLIKVANLVEDHERFSIIERHFLAIYHSTSDLQKQQIDIESINKRTKTFLNASSQKV